MVVLRAVVAPRRVRRVAGVRAMVSAEWLRCLGVGEPLARFALPVVGYFTVGSTDSGSTMSFQNRPSST